MKSARLPVFGIVLGTTLAMVTIVGIASSSEPTDPKRVARVSSAQAVESVKQFAGSAVQISDLTPGAPVDGVIDRYYEIRGQAISAAVDVNDGRIISLLLRDRVPASSKITINSPDAQLAAEAFLDTRGVSRSGLQPSVSQVNHGDSNEFVVTWQRYEGAVQVPDARIVGVDAATGSVFRYIDLRRTYTAPPSPTVDKDAAIQAAIAKSELNGDVNVEAVSLLITFDQAGEQHLVWHVALDAPTPVSAGSSQTFVSHQVVEVDATTGAAIVLARG